MSYMIRDEHQDAPDTPILFGLDKDSSNEERAEAAFEQFRLRAFIPTATVEAGQPKSRIIEYTMLKDGRLVFMTSAHKRFCKQLKENPRISAAFTSDDWIGIRLEANVREVTDDKAVWDEYFEQNPGVKKMFRHDLSISTIFELVSGTGDMYHLYDNDHIRRLRFSFGDAEVTAHHFQITDACIGCGECAAHCAEETIYQSEDGKYAIEPSGCEECGICYNACPQKDVALIKIP